MLETVFNGVYSNEMMSATKPAPDEVIQLKKEGNQKLKADKQIFMHKIVNIILCIGFNIIFGCSKGLIGTLF